MFQFCTALLALLMMTAESYAILTSSFKNDGGFTFPPEAREIFVLTVVLFLVNPKDYRLTVDELSSHEISATCPSGPRVANHFNSA